MTYRSAATGICFAGLALLLSLPAIAGPVASCNASFTVCAIPENTLLQLPFSAIAGG
jgi:hypothetical protein